MNNILFWIIIAVIVGGAIYWLMDWQSHHEDGE
jgi:heme/copper-type cytochrome/quinol oxidase subunit 4